MSNKCSPIRRSGRIIQREWNCQYCSITFPTYVQLIRHVFVHSKEMYRRAKKPNKSETPMPQKVVVAAPRPTKMKPKLFECFVCHEQYASRIKLKRHLLTYEFRMDPLARELTGNFESVHSEAGTLDSVMSTEQGAITGSHNSVPANVSAANDVENGHRCGRCQKLFLFETNLLRHERIHQWIDSQPFDINEPENEFDVEMEMATNANDIEAAMNDLDALEAADVRNENFRENSPEVIIQHDLVSVIHSNGGNGKESASISIYDESVPSKSNEKSTIYSLQKY